jgi:hypothetical protein
VTNGGETEATFFLLQGVGEYDFVPLTRVSGDYVRLDTHR